MKSKVLKNIKKEKIFLSKLENKKKKKLLTIHVHFYNKET